MFNILVKFYLFYFQLFCNSISTSISFTLSLYHLFIYLTICLTLFYIIYVCQFFLYHLCCFSRLEVSAHVALGVTLTLVRYLLLCVFSSSIHSFQFLFLHPQSPTHLSSHFFSKLLHPFLFECKTIQFFLCTNRLKCESTFTIALFI